MTKSIVKAWEFFMRLCEKFPELYDIYVEKVERKMKDYEYDPAVIEESKRRTWEKLQQKLCHEN